MHAWSQLMQTFTAPPPRPFSTIRGSARNGRDIETRSTPPPARIASASSSRLTLLPAITGTPTTEAEGVGVPVIDALIPSAQGTNAPAGTTPCTVGTGDS